MQAKTVSVIIPTKGRGPLFLNTLRSIGNQSVLVDEVIVVDQTPDRLDDLLLAGVFEVSSASPKLIYCHAPWLSGLTAARNFGVKQARGKIIQFLDDDVVLEKEYFLRLLQEFNNVDVGGVAGLVIEPNRKASFLKKTFFRLFFIGPFRQIREEVYLYPLAASIKTNTLPGVSAYRRNVFELFHFDEQLVGPCMGEDLDFSYRVGKSWKLIIQPNAHIYHFPSTTARCGERQSVADKVYFYYYHFSKNFQKTTSAWLMFFWLNVGFAMHSLTLLNLSAILGVYDGWRKILQKRH